MTAIAKTEIAQPYENEDVTAKLTQLPFTALASGATHTFPVGARGIVLLVQNTNATTAATVTIESSYDDYGRQGDITAYSITAGEIYARKFLPKGWENAAGSGQVNVTVSASGLEFCAIAL